MANNPKKVKDPTEVALSAIQEALNIGENSAEPNRDVTSTGNGEVAPPVIPPAAPPFSEAPFETRSSGERSVFEPIEEQLTRYRRVTLVLTAIPMAMGVFFMVLFAVFGKPSVGAILVAVLLLPVPSVAT